MALSLPVATLGGWAATFVPQSTPVQIQATGGIQEEPGLLSDEGPAEPQASSPRSPEGSTGGSRRGSTEGLTSFLTSCGELLDVVPTLALPRPAAVQVTLEIRPVCPTGEWISSAQVQIDLRDSAGVPLAQGRFDFSSKRLFVPGYGDPTSQLTADFGLGTAWVAPDSLAEEIASGSVHVDCLTLFPSSGEPLEAGETVTSPRVSVAAKPLSETAETRRTALAALRRQARADDPSILELEGSWVPQLSSKTVGTYDALDGKTYSLADIYHQFLALRLRYPNVRLLNSSDWDAYTLKDYWVVIAGVPFIYPNQANTWCKDRGFPPSQCFAKQLIRDGAPDGTTMHRG